jgi:hypothetical protein
VLHITQRNHPARHLRPTACRGPTLCSEFSLTASASECFIVVQAWQNRQNFARRVHHRHRTYCGSVSALWVSMSMSCHHEAPRSGWLVIHVFVRPSAPRLLRHRRGLIRNYRSW